MAQSTDLEVKGVFDILNRHKDSICEGLKQLDLVAIAFLKIRNCNADSSCSFTDAWCETERSKKLAQFMSLFEVHVFKKFLRTGKIESGDSQKQRELLKTYKILANFLEESEEVNSLLEQYTKKIQVVESQWVTLFATHVLRRLSSSKAMIISDAGYNPKFDSCFCGCGEQLQYGDTSLGNKKVWHGSVDILIGRLAVHFSNKEEEPCGVKTDSRLEKHVHQSQTESVTLGCTEHSIKEKCHSPLLTVSFSQFKMHMYDYESDLFIESENFELKPPVPVKSILALWLIINYRVFADPEVLAAYTEFGYFADFRQFLRFNKEVYENEMHFFHCKKVHSQKVPLNDEKMKKNLLEQMILSSSPQSLWISNSVLERKRKRQHEEDDEKAKEEKNYLK